ECESKEAQMLRIYPFIIETFKAVAPVIREIGRHDVDLARQTRRAASSIALNTAEAYGAAAAMSDCAFDQRSGRRTRSKLASMSPKHSATSIRSTIDCAMRSTESPPRSTASLRDEAVEHRADRIEVDEHSLVDPFEVPEARSDIETRFRLFRR